MLTSLFTLIYQNNQEFKDINSELRNAIETGLNIKDLLNVIHEHSSEYAAKAKAEIEKLIEKLVRSSQNFDDGLNNY